MRTTYRYIGKSECSPEKPNAPHPPVPPVLHRAGKGGAPRCLHGLLPYRYDGSPFVPGQPGQTPPPGQVRQAASGKAAMPRISCLHLRCTHYTIFPAERKPSCAGYKCNLSFVSSVKLKFNAVLFGI